MLSAKVWCKYVVVLLVALVFFSSHSTNYNTFAHGSKSELPSATRPTCSCWPKRPVLPIVPNMLLGALVILGVRTVKKRSPLWQSGFIFTAVITLVGFLWSNWHAQLTYRVDQCGVNKWYCNKFCEIHPEEDPRETCIPRYSIF